MKSLGVVLSKLGFSVAPTRSETLASPATRLAEDIDREREREKKIKVASSFSSLRHGRGTGMSTWTEKAVWERHLQRGDTFNFLHPSLEIALYCCLRYLDSRMHTGDRYTGLEDE